MTREAHTVSDDRTMIDAVNDDRTVNGVKGDLSNADWSATYDAWTSEEAAAADLAAARAEYWKLDAAAAARRETARAVPDA